MGKRQDFINLAKAGGSRQDFIDLAASHGVHDPAEALTIFDMLMSGALPSELKHGGIASLAPRRGRVTHPGGYAGKGHPLGPDWDDLLDYMEEMGFDIKVPLPGEHSTDKPKPKPTLHAQGGLAGILNL
jgi:hypothetical protein